MDWKAGSSGNRQDCPRIDFEHVALVGKIVEQGDAALDIAEPLIGTAFESIVLERGINEDPEGSLHPQGFPEWAGTETRPFWSTFWYRWR